MNGLGYGGLHQVNVADHLRRECVSQVLVELPILQVVFRKEKLILLTDIKLDNTYKYIGQDVL
jgi:hypothetical protein